MLHDFVEARRTADVEGAAACCDANVTFTSPLGQVQGLPIIKSKVFTKALDPAKQKKAEALRRKEGLVYHNHWVHVQDLITTPLTQELTLTSSAPDAKIVQINIYVRKTAMTKFLIRQGCAPA